MYLKKKYKDEKEFLEAAKIDCDRLGDLEIIVENGEAIKEEKILDLMVTATKEYYNELKKNYNPEDKEWADAFMKPYKREYLLQVLEKFWDDS